MIAARIRWTGPLDIDLMPDGHTLRYPVPPERWPYDPPEGHDDGCYLQRAGLFCDCFASATEPWIDDDD